MNLEKHAGRVYAAEILLSVLLTPKAFYDERGSVETIIENLEKTASQKPASFAQGIREVISEVRA